MALGVLDQARARAQVPFPPGRDHPDPGIERIGRQLEADLIVALAGGAMGDRVGADLVCDLDQPFGDQRPRDRGAEQICALVQRIGAKHRKNVVGNEGLAQVLDVDRCRPHQLGLGARRLELLALAEVGGEGHHLAAVAVLQPAQDHRGVEPPGIGQHHLPDAVWADAVHHDPPQAPQAHGPSGAVAGGHGAAPGRLVNRGAAGREPTPDFRCRT